MATDFEGVVAPELKSRTAIEDTSSPSLLDFVTELRKTKPTTRTPSLIVHARKFRRVLAGLRNEWDQVRPYRHAQATGLILGQLAMNPKLAATTILSETTNFVIANGPYGVDGILLSALSAAQILNPAGFSEAVSRLSHINAQAAQKPKNKMGIFFIDLSFGGPQAFAAIQAQPNYNRPERFGEYLGGDLPYPAEQRFEFKRAAQYQPAQALPANLLIAGYPDLFRNVIFFDRVADAAATIGLEFAVSEERGLGAGIRAIANKQPKVRNWFKTTDYARTLTEDGCVALAYLVNVLQLTVKDATIGQTIPTEFAPAAEAFAYAKAEYAAPLTNDLFIAGLAYDHPAIEKGYLADIHATEGLREPQATRRHAEAELAVDPYLDRGQAETPYDQDADDQYLLDQHMYQVGLTTAPDDIRAFPVAEEIRRPEMKLAQVRTNRPIESRDLKPGEIVLTCVGRLATTRGRLTFPIPEPLGNGLFLTVNPIKFKQAFQNIQQVPTEYNAAFPTRLSEEDIERIAIRVADIIRPTKA